MTKLFKIDSNVTGLSYAEEESYKVLPTTPTWVELEPNSYSDFGGTIKTVARNPINAGRQRKKGVVTDMDASAGFNTDLTQTNIQSLLQGFMWNDLQTKAEFTGSLTIDAAGTIDGSFTDFKAGDLVLVSGTVNNNGVKTVTAASAGSITVAETLTDETATGSLTVVGFAAASGDLTVDASGTLPVLASTALDFTTLGLAVGEWVFVGGDLTAEKFATAANNGFKRVKAIAAHGLTIDKSDLAMVADAGAGKTVKLFFGRTLKNGAKRRTYQLERKLGAPDPALPNAVQSQYVTGAVPNKFSMSIKTADKITCDMDFLAADNEARSSAEGLKAGVRVPVQETSAFNTSSDVSRIRLSVIDPANPAPEALFVYITDLSLSVDNNASANKAVGYLGSIEVTAGMFNVSASMTAYFNDVAGTQAVRDNADVTLDVILAKDNAGLVIDLPLTSLGDGKVKVEQDKAIEIPLSADAATGAKYGLDHTLMLAFFPYLPNAAQS